jgi:hypothetical protein
MSSFKQLSIITLLVVILYPVTLSAAWFEMHNLGLGDSNRSGSNNTRFTDMPDSPFILITDDKYILTYDVKTSKLRDGRLFDHDFNIRTVIPNPDGGWDLIYASYQGFSTGLFGKLYIDPHGEFGDDISLDRTYQGYLYPVGIPDKHEIWYFTDKILHLDTITLKWTKYAYPQGWDNDFTNLQSFMLKDSKKIFLISQGKTIQDYQAIIFDFDSASGRIKQADKGFFAGIKDMQIWNYDPNYYLVLKDGELWKYNPESNEAASLMHGFVYKSSNMLQDATGRYIYVYGENDDINVIDIIDRTVTSHQLSLQEGDKLYYTQSILKIGENKLLTYLARGWDQTICIINLEDFSVRYFDNLPPISILSSFYRFKDNMLISFNGASIMTMNLDTEEIMTSISLDSHSMYWSAMQGDPYPTLIPERSTMYFKKLGPLGQLELFRGGEGDHLGEVIMYPGTNTAFIEANTQAYEHIFREYNFDDNTLEDIVLDGKATMFEPDPVNKQIITLNSPEQGKGLVQFIKPHGKVRAWVPENMEELLASEYLLDAKNNIYWAIYHDIDSNSEPVNWFFFKLSTSNYELMDSFILPSSEITYPNKIKCDYSGKYLYFINYSGSIEDISDRYLVILDTEKKEVVKKITIQTNADSTNYFIAVPGIVPIPGHDKVFVWNHYGAWCIDTNNWNVIYGEVKDDPQNDYFRSSNIDGYWDEERQCVVVVDLTFSPDHKKRIVEVDLDTGNVLREIELPEENFIRVFCSGDKQNIYFLSWDKARYYICNLTNSWKKPAKIMTETNLLQYTKGDSCRFSIKIRNEEESQKARIYIWLCIPGRGYLFFNGSNFVPEIVGIPVTLPSQLIDYKIVIANFVIPEIMPKGLYNFNAMCLNEDFQFGPMGTWNFFVGD